jgi:hypothetical protein
MHRLDVRSFTLRRLSRATQFGDSKRRRRGPKVTPQAWRKKVDSRIVTRDDYNLFVRALPPDRTQHIQQSIKTTVSWSVIQMAQGIGECIDVRLS